VITRPALLKLRFRPAQHFQRQRLAVPLGIDLEIEATKARVEQHKADQRTLLMFS